MENFSLEKLGFPLGQEAKTWLELTVGSKEQQYRNIIGGRYFEFQDRTRDAQNSEICRKLSDKFDFGLTEDNTAFTVV